MPSLLGTTYCMLVCLLEGASGLWHDIAVAVPRVWAGLTYPTQRKAQSAAFKVRACLKPRIDHKQSCVPALGGRVAPRNPQQSSGDCIWE